MSHGKVQLSLVDARVLMDAVRYGFKKFYWVHQKERDPGPRALVMKQFHTKYLSRASGITRTEAFVAACLYGAESYEEAPVALFPVFRQVLLHRRVGPIFVNRALTGKRRGHRKWLDSVRRQWLQDCGVKLVGASTDRRDLEVVVALTYDHLCKVQDLNVMCKELECGLYQFFPRVVDEAMQICQPSIAKYDIAIDLLRAHRWGETYPSKSREILEAARRIALADLRQRYVQDVRTSRHADVWHAAILLFEGACPAPPVVEVELNSSTRAVRLLSQRLVHPEDIEGVVRLIDVALALNGRDRKRVARELAGSHLKRDMSVGSPGYRKFMRIHESFRAWITDIAPHALDEAQLQISKNLRGSANAVEGPHGESPNANVSLNQDGNASHMGDRDAK